jgi:hypothetical protein
VPAGEDPTPLFTATEYVAVGDSPLYQLVAEFIAIGDGPSDQDTRPTALDDLLDQDAIWPIALDDLQSRQELTRPIVTDDIRVYREVTAPSVPAVQPLAVPSSRARRAQLRAPQVPPHASPVRVAQPNIQVQPSSVRPSSVRSASVRSAELPSGRHRDGWRVAGHLSGAESARRSAARAPRHRAA